MSPGYVANDGFRPGCGYNYKDNRDLGHLRWAGRRRDFDVELEFANLSVAIETKVHADEGGRWPESWQTEGIAEQRKKLKGLCFYITYGASEFYMKPYRHIFLS